MPVEIENERRLYFTISNVSSNSLALLRKEFGQFSLLIVIFSTSLLLINLLFKGISDFVETTSNIALTFFAISAFFIIFFGIFSLLSCAIAYGAMRGLQKKSFTVRECLQQTFQIWPKILGVCLLVIVAILAALTPAIFMGGYYMIIGVPIVVFILVKFWVVIPVAIAEKLSIPSILRRSLVLTKGKNLPIVGLIFFVVILGITFMSALLPLMDKGPSLALSIIWNLLSIIVLMVILTFGLILSTTSYFLLCLEKEGAGFEEAAKVFE